MDHEKKLISSLTSPVELSQCWDTGLRGEAFTDPIYRAAYHFITEYWRSNHMELVPTREMLFYEYPSIALDGHDEESVAIDYLSETIQRKFAALSAQELMVQAAETVFEDPKGTLSTLWRESYKASQVVAPRFDRSDMSSNIEERRLRYQQRLEQQGIGLPYGLTEVDDLTHGLLPGELAVVSAYTKVGKSFFLAYVAAMLRRRGFTPIVFTLELSKEEMEERIDAYYSGVSYDRLIHSQLSFEEMRVLQRAQEELRDSGSLHIQRPPEGDRTVIEMIGRARQLGANYVLIDQLSWMDSERSYMGENATRLKYGDITKELREDISNDTLGKIPCMLAVQQNRSSMESQQRRAELWKIAESSNIERNVDIAFGLSQTREMRVNNAMRLDIMGSRRSDDASWLLQWHLQRESSISIIEAITE